MSPVDEEAGTGRIDIRVEPAPGPAPALSHWWVDGSERESSGEPTDHPFDAGRRGSIPAEFPLPSDPHFQRLTFRAEGFDVLGRSQHWAVPVDVHPDAGQRVEGPNSAEMPPPVRIVLESATRLRDGQDAAGTVTAFAPMDWRDRPDCSIRPEVVVGTDLGLTDAAMPSIDWTPAAPSVDARGAGARRAPIALSTTRIVAVATPPVACHDIRPTIVELSV